MITGVAGNSKPLMWFCGWNSKGVSKLASNLVSKALGILVCSVWKHIGGQRFNSRFKSRELFDLVGIIPLFSDDLHSVYRKLKPNRDMV